MKSSCIKSAVAVDDDLLIEFTSGRTYQYPCTSRSAAEDLARGINTAQSPGRYYHAYIGSHARGVQV